MGAKLKKITYAVVASISFILLIVSMLYNLKPEWFEWMPSLFGFDVAGMQAFLTTLGFGGTIGTLGFTMTQSSIGFMFSNNKALNAETIETVAKTVSTVIDKSDGNYKEILKSFALQSETLSKVVDGLETYQNKFENLADTIKTLINLETINLNKTLNNPLVNAETKKFIIDGLQEIGIKTFEVEKPEIVENTDDVVYKETVDNSLNQE